MKDEEKEVKEVDLGEVSQSGVDEMLASLGSPLVSEKEEEEVVEDSKKGEPNEEKLNEEEHKGETKEDEAEKDSKVEEVKEESEVEDKDATIASLKAELESLKAKPKDEVKKDEVKKKEPEAEEKSVELSDQDFVGESDLDEITRDPASLNKLLNKVYKQGVDATRKVLGEGILKAIPDIVRENVRVINEMKEIYTKFYSDNPDLKPFQKVVALVFEEIASKNPDRKYSDNLVETANEARKRLDLHLKAVEKKTKKKDETPKLPKKGGSSGRSSERPNTEPIQDEISSMLKIVNK